VGIFWARKMGRWSVSPKTSLDPDFDPSSTGDGDRSRVFWDDEYRYRPVD